MIYTDTMIKNKQRKKEKLRKIFKIITIPIVTFILIIVFYIGYLKFIKKENDINILGFRAYMVMTGSMEPNYNIGDIIVTKEIPQKNIKIGDVINYLSENGKDTVTHRVTDIIEKDGKTAYKTKGDNNNSEDVGLVESDRVKGVLLFKISKLGAIITKVLTGTGICVVIVIILLSYLRESRQEEKRIAREEARKIYNIPRYEKEDAI